MHDLSNRLKCALSLLVIDIEKLLGPGGGVCTLRIRQQIDLITPGSMLTSNVELHTAKKEKRFSISPWISKGSVVPCGKS
jgi:hypothetical protein